MSYKGEEAVHGCDTVGCHTELILIPGGGVVHKGIGISGKVIRISEKKLGSM